MPGMTPRTPRLLVAAGLITWAVMAVASSLSGGLTLLSGALWGTFAVAFFLVAATSISHPVAYVAMATQSGAVLGLTALGHGGSAGALLAVLAAQLPMVVSVRTTAVAL